MPSAIPASNSTGTYTSANHSRIKTERIAASAYDDKRRMAIKTGAATRLVQQAATPSLSHGAERHDYTARGAFCKPPDRTQRTAFLAAAGTFVTAVRSFRNRPRLSAIA